MEVHTYSTKNAASLICSAMYYRLPPASWQASFICLSITLMPFHPKGKKVLAAHLISQLLFLGGFIHHVQEIDLSLMPLVTFYQ